MLQEQYMPISAPVDDSHLGVVRFNEPHINQIPILNSHAKIKVIFAGRRFGKGEVGLLEILPYGALREVGLYLWVGLTWRALSMQRAWRLLKMYATRIWKAAQRTMKVNTQQFISEVEKSIRLPNGSEIWLRTAENPDAIQGDGIRGVVLDEFAYMKEIVWEEKVRPSLYDFNGWCLMIGTPNGEGWHSKMWRNAAEIDGWAQFHYTTYDNPTIPNIKEQLETDRKTMPEHQWRQEIMAEVVEGAGTVFHNLRDCIDPTLELPGTPEIGKYYVFGVDFAKVKDYTVVAVWDVEAKALVHYDRFNLMDYPSQVQRIAALYRDWMPALLVCDAVGVGQALVSHLRDIGLPVQEFHSNQHTKPEMIERLAIDVEYRRIRFPDSRPLIDEFQAYGKEVLPSGITRYSAPEGYHDDIVIAACLGYTVMNAGTFQLF